VVALVNAGAIATTEHGRSAAGERRTRVHTCDHFFAIDHGADVPNRIYSLSGVTDRTATSRCGSSYRRSSTRLKAKRIPSAYYYGSFDFLSSTRLPDISKKHAQFFKACKTGKAAGGVVHRPELDVHGTKGRRRATGERRPPSRRHFAPASTSCRDLQRRDVEPACRARCLIFTFGRVGRVLRHVSPPAANDVKPEYQQRGFRIPCVIVSPSARRGRVDHGCTTTRRSSAHRVRWGSRPLSMRDAEANNLATARLLEAAPRRAEDPVPRLDVGAACSA